MGRSRDAVLMGCAFEFQALSTCNRGDFGAVGAVIAQNNRIISTGYNGVPSGMEHCNHGCTCQMLELSVRRSDHAVGCAANPCKATIHAEANAIVFAARHGVGTEGATLYTTVSPCLECAKLIINAGILRVVYAQQYRDLSGIDLLNQGKVTVRNMP